MIPEDSKIRILQAFFATKLLLPSYWFSMMSQRLEATQVGSYYPVCMASSIEALEELLFSAVTEGDCPKVLNHPAIMPGCTAYTVSLNGKSGIVPIWDDANYTLEDPKKTGFVDCVMDGTLEDFTTVYGTTVILGPEDGKEVLFTFHPGLPIAPSALKAEEHEGIVVTGVEAKELGFEFAKIKIS